MESDDGLFVSPSSGSEGQSTGGESFCVCRGTEGGFMIACDGDCEDWYHGSCIGIKKQDQHRIEVYICPACTKNGLATKWKVSSPQRMRPRARPQQRANRNKQLKQASGVWQYLHHTDKEASDYGDRDGREVGVANTSLVAECLVASGDFLEPGDSIGAPGETTLWSLQELLEHSHNVPKRDEKCDIEDTYAYKLVAEAMSAALSPREAPLRAPKSSRVRLGHP